MRKRHSTDRVVVRLRTVLIPGALPLYPRQHGDKEESLEAFAVDALLLWDTLSQT